MNEKDVHGPVSARLHLTFKNRKLEDLSKEELIEIVEQIRPDIARPIFEGGPMWAGEDGAVIGYMDGVDFNYELGGAAGGNRVFPSIEDLERCKPCCASCGIVEVEVKLRRVISEENFEHDIKAAKERKQWTPEEEAAWKADVQKRRELHITVAELSEMPPEQANEILARARSK